MLAAGSLRSDRPASAENVLCGQASSDAPRVCVWREHKKYLPMLTHMAKRLGEIPQEWIHVPPTFYEFGIRSTQLGDHGFDITEGHVRAAAIGMASQVSYESLGMSKCLPPHTSERGWQAVDRIDLWLEYRAMNERPEKADAGLNMPGVAAAKQSAARIIAASESEQRQWVDEERAQLRKAGCVKVP
jgi:hypothetical protein